LLQNNSKHWASNLTVGDSYVNLSNDGVNSGFLSNSGNIALTLTCLTHRKKKSLAARPDNSRGFVGSVCSKGPDQ
jgi:hypothetical protein